MISILFRIFIAYSGYFRLSVYTWGFLLAYIRRRLSSRLRFHVFWEAGRDKNCVDFFQTLSCGKSFVKEEDIAEEGEIMSSEI